MASNNLIFRCSYFFLYHKNVLKCIDPVCTLNPNTSVRLLLENSYNKKKHYMGIPSLRQKGSLPVTESLSWSRYYKPLPLLKKRDREESENTWGFRRKERRRIRRSFCIKAFFWVSTCLSSSIIFWWYMGQCSSSRGTKASGRWERRASFKERYVAVAKEKKARFYIFRRCVVMLLFWNKYGKQ